MDEFTEYVTARWATLVRSAVLLGCTPSEAEDLVQSALERCLLKWNRVRVAEDRDAYVHRVLINCRTAVLGAAGLVAAVVAGSALLVPRTSTNPAAPAPAPASTRLVGLGHAAIAVPVDWGTDKSRCGTPQADTVLVDHVGASRLCMAFRPPGVESVALGTGSPRKGFRADETFEIDGVRAERQSATCQVSNRSTPEPAVCTSTVFLPSLKVWFMADSSTDAAEVDRVLRGINIVADRSGVPSPWTIGGPPTGPLVTSYAPLLAEVGLKAQAKRVKSPSYPSGTILGISPASGTMLPLGATVTVTVAR